MFASKWIPGFKKPFGSAQGREKRVRARRSCLERSREIDTVAEQVKQVLQTADQKLILMVRS